jgi:hypothetical protein
MARNGISRHLSVCQKRQAVIEKAQTRDKIGSETLYHLRVQDAYRSEFWLDLEMRGCGTLKDIDSYLRSIWLECCGHMSRFSIGGWQGREIPKNQRADEVFQQASELTHIYDFGTSSQTVIKMVGARKGKPTTTRPIVLMARNLMPEAECIKCKQPAAWLCEECLIEEDVWGTLCDEHAKTHPHDNYGEPVRIVNSPRMGMCGYQGPAEPPY